MLVSSPPSMRNRDDGEKNEYKKKNKLRLSWAKLSKRDGRGLSMENDLSLDIIFCNKVCIDDEQDIYRRQPLIEGNLLYYNLLHQNLPF